MNISQVTLSGLAALPIAVPIIINIWVFKTAAPHVRLFLFFLLAGLTTDLIMWYMISTGQMDHLLKVFNVYSLIESMFFFWFLWKTSTTNAVKTISRILLVGMPFFWITCLFIYPLFFPQSRTPSAVFDTAYEIVAAFLSGYALLLMAEQEGTILESPNFWLVLGIFFYCFCTFFIMSLLETLISQRIWFINNIINLITYTWYSIGLWKSRQGVASEINN